MAVATWQAGRFEIPGAGDPFARTLGNRELAATVRETVAEGAAAGRPVGSILSADRETTAALLYYAPELAPHIRAWNRRARPRDHFELTRPFTDAAPLPALLVARQAAPAAILDAFGSVHALGPHRFEAGRFTPRTIHLFLLFDYRGG
jgi:hypothetical protein